MKICRFCGEEEVFTKEKRVCDKCVERVEQGEGIERRIGEIANYYGCLNIKKEGEKFYWGIENYNGTYWEEIPKNLYDSLIEYENNRDKD
jgi:hypothetical protein